MSKRTLWIFFWAAVASGEEDPHSCAANGLTLDVYENGGAEPITRLDLDGGRCGTMAAFEAAVSAAACGDAARCHVRDGAGRRVRKCAQLAKNANEAGVQPAGVARAYAVPRDMRFVFPAEAVGFRRSLPHLGITVETLALRPRLFALDGFLTPDDADRLVADALAITDAEHRLMQSSTGATGYHASSIRTSENAWVKDTPTAAALKRRAFEMLGFDSYDERMADGVQVLRYNHSHGYVAHKDYLSRPAGVDEAAMDPTRGGANRMATVFLYLSDVADGGQTVFPRAARPDGAASLAALESRPLDDRVRALRDAMPRQKSWEPALVDECYTKLAARPARGRAILFYSQRPDGSFDDYATHGGCPILSGTKWAANLWVWNKAMPFGSTRFAATATSSDAKKSDASVDVDFRSDLSHVEIFWVGAENRPAKMGDVVPGRPFNVNSFVGHTFVAKRRGATLATYTVAAAGNTFTIA